MYTRSQPYLARIKKRTLLTTPQSSKKTFHISLSADTTHLHFKVGDSVGVMPTNHQETVAQILYALKATGDEEILDAKTNQTYRFKDYLLHKANIQKVSFHKLFDVEKTAIPLLEQVKHHKPHPQKLCDILLPLLPRFYSIASSAKMFPNEIHLTVAHVSYVMNGQVLYGVGSHFLCEQAEEEATPIPIYVQPSNHFSLPEDPNAPIILIGPGTGIAPFRAFIQERLATKSEGLNWIFFGERNRAHDFYYSDFWLDLEQKGKIRLDATFSRDQSEKIYVQHKMLERKKSLWEWIQNGSYIYVCGDAKKMAKDVNATLLQILREEGHLTEEDAQIFLKKMRAEKRYLLDVY